GKWSVQFTRRFSNKDGSFAGVVVASMDPTHFTNFYDDIDLGASTSVAMVGSDGVVRSQGGGEEPEVTLGQDLSGGRLFARLQDGTEGTFLEPGPSAAENLVITARHVRGYPLWVAVSSKEREIYASAWAGLRQKILIGAVLTALILIALEKILR